MDGTTDGDDEGLEEGDGVGSPVKTTDGADEGERLGEVEAHSP